MDKANHIIIQLRKQGCRLTAARKAILGIFEKNNEPLSCAQIRKKLYKNGIIIHKTTVYREVYFLKEKGLVAELQFKDSTKHYEMASIHHDHAICVSCNKIEDVLLRKDLKREEQFIYKNKKFKVKSHALEFYGLCSACA